jgi:hypothetical protein
MAGALVGLGCLGVGCSLANAPDDVLTAAAGGSSGAGGSTTSTTSTDTSATTTTTTATTSTTTTSTGGDACAGDPCGPHGTCAPAPSGHTCTCDAGYADDGATCADVDECATDTDDCDANATCTNGDGSFTCACNAGFAGDGKTCMDVDECATNTDDCDPNATCTNADGGFTCTCNPPSQGDGQTCAPGKYPNGLGGKYQTFTTDKKTNALLACESYWGVGQCANDGCGSCNDKGFHKAGTPNCNGSVYWNYFDTSQDLACNWVDPNEILISNDGFTWTQ